MVTYFKCMTTFCFQCGTICFKENNFFNGVYICGLCQEKNKNKDVMEEKNVNNRKSKRMDGTRFKG